MSSVDRGEAPCGCERKSSIETEPRTLYEVQLQEAREEAIDILNNNEPEEALNIFSQRGTVSTHGSRCPPPVFAVEDEMQQGLRDKQAHVRSLITEKEDDHQQQHSEHNKKQEENFVIANSELNVGQNDQPPFTERRVTIEAASAPV